MYSGSRLGGKILKALKNNNYTANDIYCILFGYLVKEGYGSWIEINNLSVKQFSDILNAYSLLELELEKE